MIHLCSQSCQQVTKVKGRCIPAIHSFILQNDDNYSSVDSSDNIEMRVIDTANFYLMDDNFKTINDLDSIFIFSVEYN